MSPFLRVGITEDERRDLNKYLTTYPFGQISHILRQAVRNFIKVEKEKAELVRKEAESGCQGRKGSRFKKT